MTREALIRRNRGFSLVELLVVVAMLGIVAMAMTSLHLSTQRTASTQDEVVELQQNLRVAMDQIARDIRLAGFMIPNTQTPISVATANALTLQVASATGRAARIAAGFSVPDPSGTPNVPFATPSAEHAALFRSANNVRILRPPNQSDLFPGRGLTVTSNPTTATVTITGFIAGDTGAQIRPGDIIVRIANGSNNPNTIDYFRSNDVLWRRTDNGLVGVQDSQQVATGLSVPAAGPPVIPNGLQFSYILDDGTEATTVTGATLDEIKAVRVTLIGRATTQDGVKTRTLSSVIALRNR